VDERAVETLIHSKTMAFIITDAEGNIESWNIEAEVLFGYGLGEVRGRPLSILIAEEHRQELAARLSSLGHEPEGPAERNSGLFGGLHKDGRHFPVEMFYSAVRRGDSRLYIATIHDVTDREPANRALLKSEAFFRMVYDYNNDMMALINRKSDIIWSNAAWYRSIGYQPGSQKTPFDAVHEEDRERIWKAFEALLREEKDFDDLVYRYRCGDGQYAYLETSVQPLPGEPYLYVRSHNITERKRLEASLAQEAKYLETTLEVSNLLNSAVGLTEVSRAIAEGLNLEAAHILKIGSSEDLQDLFQRYKELEPICKTDALKLLKRWKGRSKGLLQFLTRTVEKKGDRGNLVVPLSTMQSNRIALLLMAKKGEEDFPADEISLIRNLANTISLVIERLQYMEELRQRAKLDKDRADFSEQLFSCRSEEEAQELILDFFEKEYGIGAGILLLAKSDRFVYVRARYPVASEAEEALLNKLQSEAYLPRSADSPVSELFKNPEAKIAYLTNGYEIFRGLSLSSADPSFEPHLREVVQRSSERNGKTPVLMKLPAIGVIGGLLSGQLEEWNRKAIHLILNTISATFEKLRMEKTREQVMRQNELLHNLELELRAIPMGKLQSKMQTAVDRLIKNIGAASVSVFMPEDGEAKRVVPLATAGGLTEPAEEVSRKVAEYVVRTGEEVRVGAKNEGLEAFDTSPDKWPDGTTRERISGLFMAFYSVPIQSHRDIVGALLISADESFSPELAYFVYDAANLLAGTVKDELLYLRERDLAMRDELTGLFNRRYFLKRATEVFNMAKRYGTRFSLIMMDIDFFKRINDTYGHECGDRVLKVLSESLSNLLREVDVLGRYGGEEFILLLPETDIEGAENTAERLRRVVEELAIDYDGTAIRITLSCGVATFGENSETYRGVNYHLSIGEDRVQLYINGRQTADLGLRVPDLLDREKVASEVGKLYSKDKYAPKKRERIGSLLMQMADLKGLIAIADRRLYQSKVSGRNRVTSGSPKVALTSSGGA
jgi:diguanylate cyclase (GGDEF)-like protein/PAS domain S-box-containing protein